MKGLIVEGMPCSSLSSIKVFPNCQGGWCGWTLTQPQLGNTSLHSTGARVMLHFGACRVDDVLFSVCKLFAKCIFFALDLPSSLGSTIVIEIIRLVGQCESLVCPLTEVNERASCSFLREGDAL